MVKPGEEANKEPKNTVLNRVIEKPRSRSPSVNVKCNSNFLC